MRNSNSEAISNGRLLYLVMLATPVALLLAFLVA